MSSSATATGSRRTFAGSTRRPKDRWSCTPGAASAPSPAEPQYTDRGKTAGAQAAVTRHGSVGSFRSFGSMDLERGKPVADDTIWRIYSMSKPITSVALMSLYEKGLFQLSDPVHRFIPS